MLVVLDFEEPIVEILLRFRSLRAVMLLRHAPAGPKLFETLWRSLPRLMNLSVILLVVFYIYTVIGLNLLPYLKPDQKINRNMNFSTIGKSVVSLVTIASKESLSPILEDAVAQLSAHHVCERLFTYEDWKSAGFQYIGCGRVASYFYFITFMVVFNFTLISLFGAVLTHEMAQITPLMQGSFQISYIDRFFKTWAAFTSNQTAMLPWRTALLCLQSFTLEQDHRDVKPRSYGLIKMWMIEEFWIALKLPIYRDQKTQDICVFRNDMILAILKLQLG